VRRASNFLASLERFPSSRRPRRDAQRIARNINREKIGILLKPNASLPRSINKNPAAAMFLLRLPREFELCVFIFYCQFPFSI
jgi:hypothetical protein